MGSINALKYNRSGLSLSLDNISRNGSAVQNHTLISNKTLVKFTFSCD